MILLLNDGITLQTLLKEAGKFFCDPILGYTYLIVAIDFLFGIYRSWVLWNIESHLFDRTVDKLTKYTLTYTLFHALSLFPLPKVLLPLLGWEVFDPLYIDDIVMFLFMGRESLSILEHSLKYQRVAALWPGLEYVVNLLGRILRLAESRLPLPIEEKDHATDSNQDSIKVDK